MSPDGATNTTGVASASADAKASTAIADGGTDGTLAPSDARPSDGAAAERPAGDGGRLLVPAPWTATEIGKVKQPSVVALEGERVQGSVFFDDGLPHKRQDDPDGVLFVHQPLAADGSVTARVVSWDRLHGWGGIGVMMRASTSPTSLEMTVAATQNPDGVKAKVFYRRVVSPQGASGQTSGVVKLPLYVRLARSGSTITASISQDGTTFTMLQTLDIPGLGGPVLAGVAAWGRYYVTTFQMDAISVK
jgi:hypothetical protein